MSSSSSSARLILKPPGLFYDLEVPFPENNLAVCMPCKVALKTRKACRITCGHTAPPWSTAYICITLDESAIEKKMASSSDTSLQMRLMDVPLEVKQVHSSSTHYKRFIHTSDFFDSENAPCCIACKNAKSSKFDCRIKFKHSSLPWPTVFVTIGRHADQKLYRGNNTAEISQTSDDIHNVYSSLTFLVQVSSESTSLHWLSLSHIMDEEGSIPLTNQGDGNVPSILNSESLKKKERTKEKLLEPTTRKLKKEVNSSSSHLNHNQVEQSNRATYQHSTDDAVFETAARNNYIPASNHEHYLCTLKQAPYASSSALYPNQVNINDIVPCSNNYALESRIRSNLNNPIGLQLQTIPKEHDYSIHQIGHNRGRCQLNHNQLNHNVHNQFVQPHHQQQPPLQQPYQLQQLQQQYQLLQLQLQQQYNHHHHHHHHQQQQQQFHHHHQEQQQQQQQWQLQQQLQQQQQLLHLVPLAMQMTPNLLLNEAHQSDAFSLNTLQPTPQLPYFHIDRIDVKMASDSEESEQRQTILLESFKRSTKDNRS